ncbi:hypothetical protein QTP70_003785 [Hemibagrus guttatus]|uniref:Reverse transcriptase n=1 Tax=Hemibagrus guttatus TaxID=175788 RepID=A0AAE0Q986_9TELE|nr:hypothetical protein QTP70_003785 [Hemibagrus guttatus]
MVVCRMTLMKLRQALGGQVVLPDDWETTAEVIRETGRKVLGVSSGRRKEDKETWWWNEEVQDSIQRKRLAKKKWDMDRTEENRQEYKELQRRVKREVSKAKQEAYDELYTRLDTREGEKDLYSLARQRDRDGKDVQQVRVIKDRDGRVLRSEESVQRRWKEYFEELMNEENERGKKSRSGELCGTEVDKIRKDEVRKALKRMKSGKAVGPDDIPVEVWKCPREAAVEFLASLFNRVLENLEKAYDMVPREELWYCMRKSGVAEKYVRVVQDMYEMSRTVVSESREQVEENLERWRFALERRGMKVSINKTEYMCVNEREGSGTVRLQGEEVKKVQEFKFLGGQQSRVMEIVGKRRSKPVLKQVQTWSAGAISALQDCFECTDWDMFREAVTNSDSINMEQYTISVTSYINKCTDNVTVSRTLTTRSNQKPWMTAEVCALLKSRDSAFRAVDKDSKGQTVSGHQ